MDKKLKNIRVLFLDADGVFFDGTETRDKHGDILKSRSYQDGQGISFLRAIGITIVFITGEEEPLQSIVEKLNSLPSAQKHTWPRVELFSKKNYHGAKLEILKEWLLQAKVPISACAYMGDDVNDYEAMSYIKEHDGLSIAPANATRKIKLIADMETNAFGGNGAIREVSEKILDARNVDESTLPPA